MGSSPIVGTKEEKKVSAQVLKGIGQKNGDGYKDTTKIGETIFVWNAELPKPYAPGQFPRIGAEHWSASTEQYDFYPATVDEVRSLLVDEICNALTAGK